MPIPVGLSSRLALLTGQDQANSLRGLNRLLTGTHCVTGTSKGDAKIDAAVPEPASVMLLGGVLLFAAVGLRRRTHKA